MRGKDYNTGLRGVLFERKHYERMGAAIWLYGWLILRQTRQEGSVGWVLGGTPISYREIEEETGFNARTVERWMQILRRCSYIETVAMPAGIVIRILKAKKFLSSNPSRDELLIPSASRCKKKELAAAAPQLGGPPSATLRAPSAKPRPGYENTHEIHRDFHSESRNSDKQSPVPSGLGENQHGQYLDARLRQQLLRAERDEAVRRELAVGTGPEVQRS